MCHEERHQTFERRKEVSCCTTDEGRPLGIGLQEQVPNHWKLLRLNVVGGERSSQKVATYAIR